MKESAYTVVLITTANAAEAQRISRRLLQQKKAACVNIVSGVDSLFWWNDKLNSAHESLMVVKTNARLFPEIINLVKEEHSYAVPEIIALPVIGGNPDYLEWLDKEVE